MSRQRNYTYAIFITYLIHSFFGMYLLLYFCLFNTTTCIYFVRTFLNDMNVGRGQALL